VKTISAILAFIAAAGMLYGTQNPAAEPKASVSRGKIIFTGTATRRAINMSGTRGCPQGPQYINEAFDDVIVYANPTAPLSHPIPSDTILLDRLECRFVPHTITMDLTIQ
jgi:hypothetical protein